VYPTRGYGPAGGEDPFLSVYIYSSLHEYA
jgi:hypothetical protein